MPTKYSTPNPNEYEKEEMNDRLVAALFPLIQQKQNEVATEFLKKHPQALFTYSNSRQSLLHVAVESKNYEMMDFLLAKVDSLLKRIYQKKVGSLLKRMPPKKANYLLNRASQKIVCMRTGETFIDCRNVEGDSALMLAIKKQDIEAVRLILKYHPSLDVIEYESKEKALHLAAEVGNVEIFKELWNEKKSRDKNADIDEPCGKCGYTCLHIATINGNLDMVKFLVEEKADVNKKSIYGRTTAMLAAANQQEEVYKYVASLPQTDLTIEDHYGKTVDYFLNPRNLLAENADDYDKFMDTLTKTKDFDVEEADKLIDEFFDKDDLVCPVVVATQERPVFKDPHIKD